MGGTVESMGLWLGAVAVLLHISYVHSLHVKGSIELDAWTFDKIVGGDKPVLVKFDKDYAYGDKEDQFKELCKRLGEAGADILVGVVGVQEYGDKLNQDLSDKFKLNKDDFPVYKLFTKGSSVPVDYKGEVKADDLSRFLKKEAKLYIGLPGCLEDFDALAKQFVTGDKAATKAATENAAMKLTRSDEKDSGKYYSLVMKKILERGNGFVESEIDRLQKMVDSGSISEEKKQFFQRRLNILPSFLHTKEEL